MSDVYEWPLPYLIKPDAPIPVKVFLDPLPTQRVLSDDFEGIGKLEIRLGGATWDVRAGRADSVKEMVPSPITGVISATASDLHDYFLQEGLVFVSARFREICGPLIKDAEFLPAIFKTSIQGSRSLGEGPEVDDYFWLNTWNRIDLVDFDNSVFSPTDRRPGPRVGHPDQISTWEHLALRPTLHQDDHFFGILQVVGEARYASVELRNAAISADLRMKFEPILLSQAADYFERLSEYSEQLNGKSAINLVAK